ncbi:S41 family peptidase [Cohnella massiliensis]|uniref:S41 family peptidase n=1 Tax=Cohnella massiliensis TaxID=1816691 RepID=UPI0009BB37F2|nr:S41 family peptidase [Cohnella massiliensis]
MRFRGRTVIAIMACTALLACLATIGYLDAAGKTNRTSSSAGAAADSGGLRPDELEKLNRTIALIEGEYRLSVDRDELIDGAIRGMVEALGDPYSVYMTGDEAAKFTDAVEGTFTGIGARLGIEDGEVVVRQVMEGTPADRAGLQAEDILLSVNGNALQGLSLGDAIAQIRGPKGTKAKLRVERPGAEQMLELELIRDLIMEETAIGKLGEDGVGKLKITRFSFDTAEKASQALREMEDQGMRALVLDLRNNPGGVMPSALGVAELFVPQGKPIVISEDKNGVRTTERSNGSLTAAKAYPILVLIDKGSASAAEIVAGALKHSAGAALLGETTYGKGTVQISFEKGLDDGSLVKLTVSKWLLPDGSWIDDRGIVPDVSVSQPAYFGASRLPRDKVLKPDETGDDVRNLQLMLEGAGFPADRADGYFSSATEEALKSFQRHAGLPETGIADERTAERLEEEFYRALQNPEFDAQWVAARDILLKMEEKSG